MIKSETVKSFIEQRTLVELTPKNKRTRPSEVRNYYYHLACTFCKGETLEEIGKTIDRTHASVLHGKDSMEWILEKNFSSDFKIIDEYNSLKTSFMETYGDSIIGVESSDLLTDVVQRLTMRVEVLESKLKQIESNE